MNEFASCLVWRHDPICKLSETEWIRYQDRFGNVEHSRDNGETWRTLPWTISRANRILLRLAREKWPPHINGFGFYKGNVAIAWHNVMSEDEVNIAKHIATFDDHELCWRLKYMGLCNLEEAMAQVWVEEIGFTVFNRMSPVLEQT